EFSCPWQFTSPGVFTPASAPRSRFESEMSMKETGPSKYTKKSGSHPCVIFLCETVAVFTGKFRLPHDRPRSTSEKFTPQTEHLIWSEVQLRDDFPCIEAGPACCFSHSATRCRLQLSERPKIFTGKVEFLPRVGFVQ